MSLFDIYYYENNTTNLAIPNPNDFIGSNASD